MQVAISAELRRCKLWQFTRLGREKQHERVFLIAAPTKADGAKFAQVRQNSRTVDFYQHHFHHRSKAKARMPEVQW